MASEKTRQAWILLLELSGGTSRHESCREWLLYLYRDERLLVKEQFYGDQMICKY